MNLLIGCLLVVEDIKELNNVRRYIRSNNNNIGIMCYAVVKAPLYLKSKKVINSSLRGDLLCILSISHGYDPISMMIKRRILPRSSTILISDIDDSEKIRKGDEVLLKKAVYIHNYSGFIGYFNRT
jgi:hypothetical protein